jgi:hypothetical protein
VPEIDQVRGRLPHGQVVVDAEPLRRERRVLAEQLHMRGALEQLDRLAVRARRRHDGDARDPAGRQLAQVAQLDRPVVVGLGQHELEALSLHDVGQLVGDRGVEAVANVGYHQPDDLAGGAAHHPRRPVADVPQLGGRLAHAELGLLADALVVGQRPAHGRDRQLQAFGDVPGRDHAPLTLPARPIVRLPDRTYPTDDN